MKTHTTIGAEILSGSRVPLLVLAKEIAFTHHEQWDGLGYPRGLKGEIVPLAGRIVSVADAYDAMTNDRPYRKARSAQEALDTLRRGAGSQWDETIVGVFETTRVPIEDDKGTDAGRAGAAPLRGTAERSRR